jgi:hypothetical protein
MQFALMDGYKARLAELKALQDMQVGGLTAAQEKERHYYQLLVYNLEDYKTLQDDLSKPGQWDKFLEGLGSITMAGAEGEAALKRLVRQLKTVGQTIETENKKIIDDQRQLAEENTKHMQKWIEDELGNQAKAEKTQNEFKANLRKLLGVQEDSESHARDEKWKADQLAKISAIEDNNKKEEELNKEKLDKYVAFGQQIGETLGQAIADGTLTAKEASEILIMNALDALGKFAVVAIAKSTIESLALPDSIATFGIVGIARAVILTALIETAVAAAKGVISKNLYTGGYTGSGGKYEPAGIVHKGEWVANADMVNSPAFAPMIQAMEYARVNGMQGYANGGGPGMSTSGSGAGGSSPSLIGADPRLVRTLDRLNRILDNGVTTRFDYVAVDNLRKGMNKLEDIESDVSMG